MGGDYCSNGSSCRPLETLVSLSIYRSIEWLRFEQRYNSEHQHQRPVRPSRKRLALHIDPSIQTRRSTIPTATAGKNETRPFVVAKIRTQDSSCIASAERDSLMILSRRHIIKSAAFCFPNIVSWKDEDRRLVISGVVGSTTASRDRRDKRHGRSRTRRERKTTRIIILASSRFI